MRVHEYHDIDQWGHDRSEILPNPDDIEYWELGDEDPDPGDEGCVYYYYPPGEELQLS